VGVDIPPTKRYNYPQEIKWRVPCISRRWRGKAEVVMTKSDIPNIGAYIDIRIRKTIEHPSGVGFTREGVRLPARDAASLCKAIMAALQDEGK